MGSFDNDSEVVNFRSLIRVVNVICLVLAVSDAEVEQSLMFSVCSVLVFA